jgi:hypothetical protein
MASPLFVRSTPTGIRWSVVLVPTASGRWLELEISKVGTRGLLRRQRVLWDLSAASWDRGRHPLALPKAVAAQLEQHLAHLDPQGPSGGWQFRSESRPRAVAPIRRRLPRLAVAIGSHGRALPAALLGELFMVSPSRPAGAQLAKAA